MLCSSVTIRLFTTIAILRFWAQNCHFQDIIIFYSIWFSKISYKALLLSFLLLHDDDELWRTKHLKINKNIYLFVSCIYWYPYNPRFTLKCLLLKYCHFLVFGEANTKFSFGKSFYAPKIPVALSTVHLANDPVRMLLVRMR